MTQLRLILLLVLMYGVIAAAQDRAAGAGQTAWDILSRDAGLVGSGDEPVKCGFPVLTYALSHRDEARGDRLLALQKILTRPVMHVSVPQGKFRVHYDTAGYNTPAMLTAAGLRIPGTAEIFVDSVLSMLEFVEPYESQTLGYGPLPSDGTGGGGPEYDVYILELGNMYGYTTPDGAVTDGGKAPTFITIDNDFVFVHPDGNRGMPGLRVTLAHELHHALQIGNYGYWTSDVFFYEITSTWIEDVVYPDVNDYYEYLRASWGHFRNPDKPFASDDLIMYSRGIWGHFVTKKYDPGVMRNTWEAIRSVPPIQAIDQTLRTRGTDLATAFGEWALWNAFTGSRSVPGYYTDAGEYPPMIRVPVEFTPPARDVSGILSSLSSRYYEVVRGSDTLTVVVNNADAVGAEQPSPPARSYVLRLRSTRPGDSYRETVPGLYALLDVANVALWRTWYISGDSVNRDYDPEALVEGRPFPNPFLPDGLSRVYLPVAGGQEVRGSLFIYSAGLDVIYASGEVGSTPYLGRQMFSWDGRGERGDAAPSGIYVYVLQLPDKRITGKIAIVRK